MLHKAQGKDKNDDHFDLFVRLGDDTILSEPIGVQDVFDAFQNDNDDTHPEDTANRTTVSLPCQCVKNGLVDQVDFVSPKAAKDYFTLPYALFYRQSQKEPQQNENIPFVLSSSLSLPWKVWNQLIFLPNDNSHPRYQPYRPRGRSLKIQ